MSANALCLQSNVKNISSQGFYLSCIGNHGVYLAPGAETTVFGTVWEHLRKGGRDQTRKINSLIAALEAQIITITETPSPIFHDKTLNKSQQLQLDNDVVAGVDPCYSSYFGSI